MVLYCVWFTITKNSIQRRVTEKKHAAKPLISIFELVWGRVVFIFNCNGKKEKK